MLTVGGGEIAVSDVTDTFSVFYYGALRIIQPLFTVFLVTLGINQILNGKREDYFNKIGVTKREFIQLAAANNSLNLPRCCSRA